MEDISGGTVREIFLMEKPKKQVCILAGIQANLSGKKTVRGRISEKPQGTEGAILYVETLR